MLNVGVIGLGMMGWTHLDSYARRKDVKVVAVSDSNPKRLSGEERAAGNIDGQAEGGFSFDQIARYDEGKQLIADDQVQLVDVCLPTPLHAEYAAAALQADKHVLVEKPVGRTAAQAQELVRVAQSASRFSMPGMCMRFWPGWDWLKQAIDEGRYGQALSAHFRRVTSHPGGRFYLDGEQCGGALLDLHVHDTDFIKHCFGMPDAVFSRGYSRITSETDHVVTQYLYPGGPIVSAEGGWTLQDGFGFCMQFTVNFEKATADFDLGRDQPLQLTENGNQTAIELDPAMGYDREIAYFIDCIASDRAPTVVTIADAAESIRIAEAERRSIETGSVVKV